MKIFLVVAAVLIGFLVVYFFNKNHRPGRSYDEVEAEKVASWKLNIKFKENIFLVNKFQLIEKSQEMDGAWTFTYRAERCDISITVDQSGAADISGMSEGCI